MKVEVNGSLLIDLSLKAANKFKGQECNFKAAKWIRLELITSRWMSLNSATLKLSIYW